MLNFMGDEVDVELWLHLISQPPHTFVRLSSFSDEVAAPLISTGGGGKKETAS